MTFTISATILQTPTRSALEVREDQIVTVGDDGRILSIAPATAAGPHTADVVLPPSTILMPGLIDTHLHAPQWPQLGAGLDLPLEQWLFEHTFPLEAKYADLTFAQTVWYQMVPRLLAEGTTTAVYYSSIHEEATLALAQTCDRLGQRAFVGRVAMDHPTGTPPSYRDASAAEGLAASRRSIDAIQALNSPVVQPIITPRFIPACTDELLEGLGALAAETGVRVQTHCSENDWEHHYAFERYGVSDATALEQHGLVRNHTVMAHGGHISDEDRTILMTAGAGVAHCPLSNAYFGDAVFPARRHLDAGLRVGLGTDVAGGPESSMLAVCGQAVTSSRMLEDGVNPALARGERQNPDNRIDIVTAFWMATIGGAELLGIDAGLLEPGRFFDAVAIDLTRVGGDGVWPQFDDWPRQFEKAVRRSRAEAISAVWVNGRLVSGRDRPSPAPA